ncbi:hypothetical protein PoB_007049800 [Plakobranchus ocellatus]|uniref:Uncharacterized protein n=1 Tax=Plakobranchus ocellatus TaxID=259542 RepID=A0AAV4DIE3_9GAST|nr:hypothetical protein PoB_007049800 [Plakobranchus ocellatus]
MDLFRAGLTMNRLDDGRTKRLLKLWSEELLARSPSEGETDGRTGSIQGRTATLHKLLHPIRRNGADWCKAVRPRGTTGTPKRVFETQARQSKAKQGKVSLSTEIEFSGLKLN